MMAPGLKYNTNEFSEKEKSLIEAMGFDDVAYSCSICAPRLYDMMALHCFKEKLNTKAAESVRRCLTAIDKRNPYRLTKEFDDLIEL